jgi:dTDP-glucose pyrophosphorylase/predicted transcriptional regulator
MKSIRNIMITPEMSLLEAMALLDQTALQILLVVDAQGHLLGTVTDGDIRRMILRGEKLSLPISNAMNANPITISSGKDRKSAISLMKKERIHGVPVLDKSARVVGLETESQLLWQDIENTWVVIMAGGLGMRLRPLTETVPKPMLNINGRPLLERIMEGLQNQGFRRFVLSVNYKSEMVKDHFGDGAARGVEIVYVEESKPLGTGGALSLLPERCHSENIVVMNGDLLTSLNFRHLLDYHREHGSAATMTVRDYSFQVPYGVVEVEGESFVDIIEKPAHSYFVNAGIYVLGIDQLQCIPKGVSYDLPNLFSLLKSQGKKVTIFPLYENWTDIGSMADYEMAQKDTWHL